MDKYTYSLKMNKIQDLVRKADYETAAKIADTMEWNQERNVRLLNAAAEAYERVGRVADAVEMLLRAYDRSSAGKRILYKLTELSLLNGKIKDAETFYKKYLDEAGEDSDRYILRYRIAEAKEEPNARKISILEAYNRQEFEEEWACALAELYSEEDMKDKCVKLCDDIVLWFNAGPYVQRALDLKEQFEPLTPEQRDRRENRAYYEAKVQKVAEEMAEMNAAAEEEAAEVPEAEGVTAEEAKSAEYSASVDPILIRELMEEEVRDAEAQASAEEAEGRLIRAAAQIREAQAAPEVPEEMIPRDETEEAEAGEAVEAEEIPQVPEAEEPAQAEETEETAEAEEPAQAEETEEAAEAEVPQESEGEEPAAQPEAPAEPAGLKDDVTREIVIPKELLNHVAVAAQAAPAAETPEEAAAGEEAVEVVPAEEEEPAAELPQGYEHEHCIFLDNENGKAPIEKAVDALDDYYSARDEEMSPLAKISAAKLNERGLIRSMPKLDHKDLIIDNAGRLEDDILKEVLELLDGMDPDKMFVLMDTEEKLAELKIRMLALSHIPGDLPKIVMTETEGKAAPVAAVADTTEVPTVDAAEEAGTAEKAKARKSRESKVSFANIDPDQVISERDFMRYAEYFAKELECTIDDSGFDALEELMEEILQDNGDLTAGDVEDIIEDAADDAEKMGLRRLLTAKYDKEGFLILRKKNFS